MSSIEQIAVTGIPSASSGQGALLSSGRGGSSPAESRDGVETAMSGSGIGELAKERAGEVRESARGKGAGVDPEDLNEAIEAIRDKLEPSRRALDFSVNETLNDVIVKVIDPVSDQVIREIPPEAIIAMRERLREYDEISASDLMPAGTLFNGDF